MTVTDAPTRAVTMTYREAIREAMSEAMRADSRVFLMGEDVGEYGGCYAVSKGMLEEFGGERIIDTPLSLSLIHISEPTRLVHSSRMPSSA